MRLYAEDFLEGAEFEVVEAADADAALRVLRNRPDVRVLFTDIQLPGKLDGLELARRVHEQWPNALLLITSGNTRPSRAEIADHGHFLAKPYLPHEVIRRINDLAREQDARRGREQGQRRERK